MNLHEATHIAARLRQELLPFCRAVEIAGSIRREKPEVKDVELVAVPRWEPSQVTNLFGEAELLNRALVWAFDAEARGEVQWIKPGTPEVIPWEPRRDGKYWRGLLKEGLKLDLFLATPENFGLIQTIRTGPAEFSQLLVTDRASGGYKPGHLKVREGQLWDGATVVPTPTEAAVFEALGVEYLEPQERGVRQPRLFASVAGAEWGGGR